MKTAILLFFLLPTLLLAQGPPPGPPEFGFEFVAGEMAFEGRVVKGAPYSAEAVTETVQVLADGNRITRRNTAMLYRDSEGRTRREMSLGAIGPWPSRGEARQTVFVNDPVTGVNYVLDPEGKTARKMSMRRPPGEAMMRRAPAARPQPRVESLGKRLIEGVEAEGTRTTLTLPPGEVGNERPIEIVSERWFSRELQTLVMSRRSDPRMGETTYKLTNIRRNEPLRSLFEPPHDYTLRDGPSSPGSGMQWRARPPQPQQ
jgi:hypothetical protein